jgi:hypothetical protein
VSSEALERALATLHVIVGEGPEALAVTMPSDEAAALLAEVARLEQALEHSQLDAALGRAALAVAREREQLLHDYLADVASCTPHKQGCDEPDDPSCAACIAAAGLTAHAAALAEPETGQLSRPVSLRASAAGTLSDQRAAHVPSAGPLASGSASAAADEPRAKWLASLHEDAAADEPGETPT